MVKGVSRELEREIRRVLEESASENPSRFRTIRQGIDRLEYEAIHYLADVGAFEQAGSGSFRLTASGREYWDQLNAPRCYWFRRNWLPALVGIGTILFGGASAATNIVNLVL